MFNTTPPNLRRAEKTSRIRILYTMEEKRVSQYGGSLKALLNILGAIDRRRFDPFVLLTWDESARSAFKGLDVPVWCLPFPCYRKSKSILTIPFVVYKFHRLLRNEKIDLVHVNTGYNDVPYVGLTASRLGIPAVLTSRSSVELREKFIPYRFKSMDRYIVVSRSMESELRRNGVRDEHFETIHSGIDLACFRADLKSDSQLEQRRALKLPEEATLVGMVANLAPMKGQEFLIRAVGLLAKRFQDLHCLLVGGGDRSFVQHLQALTADLGIANRVIFPGHQEDVRPYLIAMDLFVLSSLSEAFGIALIEAMAFEKPVVASRVGGIPEVVENGVTGILVPPGDEKSLAEVIGSLLANPQKSKEMGRAGGNRVANLFSLEKEVSRLEECYLRLLQRSARSTSSPLQRGVRQIDHHSSNEV